jgi:hypothetical protein
MTVPPRCCPQGVPVRPRATPGSGPPVRHDSEDQQLRNLQTLVEVGVDKNSTVVFPAPLMSTIGELGSFLAREKQAAGELTAASAWPSHSEDGALAAS